MKASPLLLPGAHLVNMQEAADERGYFARLWCSQTFAAWGLPAHMVQASASFNHHAGTVRGLHFAWPPADEGKLVRCARGRMFDVLLDLRPASTHFGRWVSVLLDADEHNAVYVPPGVAHGFQTLQDGTEVHYLMTEAYRPELATGVRFDDPAWAITWPLPVQHISDRDRNAPLFNAQQHAARFALVQGQADAAAFVHADKPTASKGVSNNDTPHENTSNKDPSNTGGTAHVA